MDKFREILKKYNIDVDYVAVVETIGSLIREYSYQKENMVRTSLDKKINLIPAVNSLPKTYNYKDLFSDTYFIYNLNNNEYYEKELELFYAILVFLNEYFYIDDSFDIEKVKLLKNLINDKDLEKIFLQNLDKKPKALVRESSYYYKDDVYKFVVDNKLVS